MSPNPSGWKELPLWNGQDQNYRLGEECRHLLRIELLFCTECSQRMWFDHLISMSSHASIWRVPGPVPLGWDPGTDPELAGGITVYLLWPRDALRSPKRRWIVLLRRGMSELVHENNLLDCFGFFLVKKWLQLSFQCTFFIMSMYCGFKLNLQPVCLRPCPHRNSAFWIRKGFF